MDATIRVSECELSNFYDLLTFTEYMIAHSEYGDDRSLKATDLKGLRSAKKILARLTSSMPLKSKS